MTIYYVDGAVGNDANAGTSEGSGNAWATIQKAADTLAAGDLAHIKASATYNEDVDFDTTDGTSEDPITLQAYTTTPGDGGQATIDGANTRAHCISIAGRDHYIFKNFILTGATAHCVNNNTGETRHWMFDNCTFTDGSATPSTSIGRTGYQTMNFCSFCNCTMENMSSHGVTIYGSDLFFDGCVIHNNGGAGISIPGYNSRYRVIRCLIYENAQDGFKTGAACRNNEVLSCTIVDNTGDGIDLDDANQNIALMKNNLITHNGAYGIRVTTTGWVTESRPVADYNAFYSNTSGATLGSHLTGDNDVTLTADPYTARASDDYTLNNTAGGGAACRAAGSVPFMDIGALQHEETGGGGGGAIVNQGLHAIESGITA